MKWGHIDIYIDGHHDSMKESAKGRFFEKYNGGNILSKLRLCSLDRFCGEVFNHLIIINTVCRSAPAVPGLLIMATWPYFSVSVNVWLLFIPCPWVPD